MRNLVVFEHLSLDGVIQGPGSADEDTSGGFSLGGWIGGYSDPVLGEALGTQMRSSFDLLLGRKTYDIWAPYWPNHGDIWPQANAAVKFVASRTLVSGPWQPSVILDGDVVSQVRQLKQRPGPDLHVWGSADLVQTLLAHHLIDTFWLMVYPVTLGTGKRLFGEGTVPAAFTVKRAVTTTRGVLLVTYGKDEGMGGEGPSPG